MDTSIPNQPSKNNEVPGRVTLRERMWANRIWEAGTLADAAHAESRATAEAPAGVAEAEPPTDQSDSEELANLVEELAAAAAGLDPQAEQVAASVIQDLAKAIEAGLEMREMEEVFLEVESILGCLRTYSVVRLQAKQRAGKRENFAQLFRETLAWEKVTEGAKKVTELVARAARWKAAEAEAKNLFVVVFKKGSLVSEVARLLYIDYNPKTQVVELLAKAVDPIGFEFGPGEIGYTAKSVLSNYLTRARSDERKIVQLSSALIGLYVEYLLFRKQSQHKWIALQEAKPSVWHMLAYKNAKNMVLPIADLEEGRRKRPERVITGTLIPFFDDGMDFGKHGALTDAAALSAKAGVWESEVTTAQISAMIAERWEVTREGRPESNATQAVVLIMKFLKVAAGFQKTEVFIGAEIDKKQVERVREGDLLKACDVRDLNRQGKLETSASMETGNFRSPTPKYSARGWPQRRSGVAQHEMALKPATT